MVDRRAGFMEPVPFQQGPWNGTSYRFFAARAYSEASGKKQDQILRVLGQ
jgi:hypothetical protein